MTMFSLFYFLIFLFFSLFPFLFQCFLQKKMFVLTAMSLPFPFQGAPVLPGRCWAFHGVQGTLVISLSHPIRISHVTLDHLPRSNSPTGDINSAPKDFEVYVSDPSIEIMLLANFNVHPVCSRTCSLLLNMLSALERALCSRTCFLLLNALSALEHALCS